MNFPIRPLYLGYFDCVKVSLESVQTKLGAGVIYQRSQIPSALSATYGSRDGWVWDWTISVQNICWDLNVSLSFKATTFYNGFWQSERDRSHKDEISWGYNIQKVWYHKNLLRRPKLYRSLERKPMYQHNPCHPSHHSLLVYKTEKMHVPPIYYQSIAFALNIAPYLTPTPQKIK